MTLHLRHTAVLAAVCALGISTASAQTRGQFQGLDSNHDGVISRDEWRGNDRSFRNHDLNGDGVITRDEMRQVETRSGSGWTSDDFIALDRNNDGRVSRWEWREDYGQFDRIDRNQDGQISRAEFLGAADPDRTYDRNRDGVVSRDEVYGQDWTSQHFDTLDRNNDGRLNRGEWPAGYGTFDRVDRNQDGVVSRREFLGDDESTSAAPASAYQAGHERGFQDGRTAGRDDRNRGRWDLDGQQELERADSGYRNEFGAFDQYQAGYREAFMIGYRESFGRGAPAQGAAYRAGREQGLRDGQQAGREDATRRHWDLEGQRELVMADAGYRNGLGSRADYETGYREGFKIGYQEGFGRR